MLLSNGFGCSCQARTDDTRINRVPKTFNIKIYRNLPNQYPTIFRHLLPSSDGLFFCLIPYLRFYRKRPATGTALPRRSFVLRSSRRLFKPSTFFCGQIYKGTFPFSFSAPKGVRLFPLLRLALTVCKPLPPSKAGKISRHNAWLIREFFLSSPLTVSSGLHIRIGEAIGSGTSEQRSRNGFIPRGSRKWNSRSASRFPEKVERPHRGG